MKKLFVIMRVEKEGAVMIAVTHVRYAGNERSGKVGFMKDLLVDIGSTFIKYAVQGEGAQTFKRVPFPERKATGDEHYFVDRAAIEHVLGDIIAEGESAGCERAFFSVQMHGFLWRRADGTISDYVSWRDKSGRTDGDGLRDIDFSLRGTALKKNLPLCKSHLWKDGVEFFTLGSFIAYLLTGVNATHISDACASGFFDAETGKVLSLSDMKMPKACFGTAFLGMHGALAVYAWK